MFDEALRAAPPPIVGRFIEVIINPAILLLFVVALLVFFWGIVEFIGGMENEERRDAGKRHLVWGVIGMFVMVSVWGILGIVLGTFGIPLPF